MKWANFEGQLKMIKTGEGERTIVVGALPYDKNGMKDSSKCENFIFRTIFNVYGSAEISKTQ